MGVGRARALSVWLWLTPGNPFDDIRLGYIPLSAIVVMGGALVVSGMVVLFALTLAAMRNEWIGAVSFGCVLALTVFALVAALPLLAGGPLAILALPCAAVLFYVLTPRLVRPAVAALGSAATAWVVVGTQLGVWQSPF